MASRLLLVLLLLAGCTPRPDLLAEVREWAARTNTPLASPEQVEASYTRIPIPARPTPRPDGPWPEDMRGLAHDFVWTENPPEVVQRVLYARTLGGEAAPVSDWAGDPSVALLMLTGQWDYYRASAPYVALRDVVDWRPGESVADVGTGVGALAFMLWQQMVERGRGDEVLYAEDVNPRLLEFVEYAARRLGCGDRLRTIVGSADDPGLPPGSVDVIVLASVYHWVLPRSGKGSPPADQVDETVRRVYGPFMENLDQALRPGGRMVITGYPHMLSEKEHEREILDLLGYRKSYRLTRTGTMHDNHFYLVLTKR